MEVNSLLVLSIGMDIFHALTVQLFLKGYFGTEKIKKYCIVSLWTTYIVSSNIMNTNDINPMFNLLLSYGFFTFIPWITFKASLKNSALMALFIIVMGMLAEVLVVFFLSSSLKIDTNAIIDSDRYMMLAQVYSKISIFVILRICFLFSKQKRDKLLSNVNWIIIFVIPFGSICLVYNTVLDGSQNMAKGISFQDMLSILIILAINLFVYYLYDNIVEDADLKLQNQLYEQQAAYYLRQYQDYEQNNFEIRQLKHDMKNQFIVLKEYVQKGETTKIMEQINRVLIDKKSNTNYAQSNNLQIDAVINYKIDYGKQYNIEFNLQIEVPNELFVDELDLCVILGNAIDNAIDACLKLSEEKRLIKMILKYKNETLYIAILNPMKKAEKCEVDHKWETTKKNKREHGIGLKSIEKVVEKYNGCMELKELSETMFQLELFLYKVNHPNPS